MVIYSPPQVSPSAMCEFTSLRGTVCFRRIKTFPDGRDLKRQLNNKPGFPIEWKQNKHPKIRLWLRAEREQIL